MHSDPQPPLLLDLAHPLDARHAPGGSSVDLTLYPVGGAAPVCVRLSGHAAQLLIVSVRTAQQAVCPAELDGLADADRAAVARGGLSPAEWLAQTFSGVLPPKRAASSSSTSARNAGTSNSAAIASIEGAVRSSTV